MSSGSIDLGATTSGGPATNVSNATGVLPTGNGGTGTPSTFTPGSVVFAGPGGTYAQDNANLFWDDTANRLGLGSAAPTACLQIDDTITGSTTSTLSSFALNTTISPSASTTGARDSLAQTVTVPGSNNKDLGQVGALLFAIENNGSGNVDALYGSYGYVTQNGSSSGLVNYAVGVGGFVQVDGGNIGGVYASDLEAIMYNGTITEAYSAYVGNYISSSSTVQTSFGIYLSRNGDGAAVGSSYSIFSSGSDPCYFGGNVGFGITNATNRVHVDAGTATAGYAQFTAKATTGQAASDGFLVGVDASANAVLNQQENLPIIISANNVEALRIKANGGFLWPATITPVGTVGSQTINKISGVINFPASTGMVTVTNSLVGTGSMVFAVIRSSDATAGGIKSVIPSSGAFNISLTSSTTAATSVGFFVVS